MKKLLPDENHWPTVFTRVTLWLWYPCGSNLHEPIYPGTLFHIWIDNSRLLSIIPTACWSSRIKINSTAAEYEAEPNQSVVLQLFQSHQRPKFTSCINHILLQLHSLIPSNHSPLPMLAIRGRVRLAEPTSVRKISKPNHHRCRTW